MPINTLITVLLSLFIVCLTSCPPCKADERCSPGIGCIALEKIQIQATTTDCGGIIISSSLTPSLRCVYLRCVHDASLLCATVIETDQCYLQPLVTDDNNGARVAQQGDFTSRCAASQCNPVTGCPDSPTTFTCCQVVVNLTLTPTLRCFTGGNNDCLCTSNAFCPELVETDLCHRPPLIPSVRGFVASQGRGIGCASDARCISGRGCVSVTTLTPIVAGIRPLPSSLFDDESPQADNNDRGNFALFFLAYGVLLLLILVLVGFCLRR